ncbi:MAG: right-handed parallel beta-helix repeat-containing protein, partial [Pseudomonadota bacterium]
MPAACGTGTWGDLPVDEATIHVDAAAAEGGDGSAAAPLSRIQPALDLAGERGGGLVAVAAGVYPEALTLSVRHGGVHLAGRCRELVVLDGDGVEGDGVGLMARLGTGEAQVSGLAIRDTAGIGVGLASGTLALRDVQVFGCDSFGIAVEASIDHPASLDVTDSLVEACSGTGLTAAEPGAKVSLQGTTIRGTLPHRAGVPGYGLNAYGGAAITAVGCLLERNISAGVHAVNPETLIRLEGSTIADTQPDAAETQGMGVYAWNAATVELVDCLVSGSSSVGVFARDWDTAVRLLRTTIRDTLPDGDGHLGVGALALGTATLEIVDSSLLQNSTCGLQVDGEGTHALLMGSEVLDTLPAEGGWGMGLLASNGADLQVQGSLVRGNAGAGVYATESAQVALSGSMIRDTVAGPPDGTPAGVNATAGATVSLHGCGLVGNSSVGVMAEGAIVSLEDTYIWETRTDADGHYGRGLDAAGGASLTLRACDLAGNTSTGVLLDDPGTRVALVDTSIRDTRLDPEGHVGIGIIVGDGASLRAEGCLVQGNATAGIDLEGPEAAAVLVDTVVRDTLPDGAGLSGAGVVVHGGRLDMRGSLLEANRSVGLTIDMGGFALVRASTVRDTVPYAQGGGGYGVQAHGGARLLAEDLSVTDNTTVGVLALGEGTVVALGDTSIRGTVAGFGEQGATAVGLGAQLGAVVSATGLAA